MTKTAYTGNPASSARDLVRYLIGDTSAVAGDIELTDEEIAYEIATTGTNYYRVAARLCDSLIARLKAVSHDYSDSTVKEFLSQKMEHYQDLKKSLRAKAHSGTAILSTGGRADIAADVAADTNITQPAFSKKMHDNTE